MKVFENYFLLHRFRFQVKITELLAICWKDKIREKNIDFKLDTI